MTEFAAGPDYKPSCRIGRLRGGACPSSCGFLLPTEAVHAVQRPLSRQRLACRPISAWFCDAGKPNALSWQLSCHHLLWRARSRDGAQCLLGPAAGAARGPELRPPSAKLRADGALIVDGNDCFSPGGAGIRAAGVCRLVPGRRRQVAGASGRDANHRAAIVPSSTRNPNRAFARIVSGAQGPKGLRSCVSKSGRGPASGRRPAARILVARPCPDDPMRSRSLVGTAQPARCCWPLTRPRARFPFPLC